MRHKMIRVMLAVVLTMGVAGCADADDPELGENDPASTTLPEEMVPTTLAEDQ